MDGVIVTAFDKSIVTASEGLVRNLLHYCRTGSSPSACLADPVLLLRVVEAAAIAMEALDRQAQARAKLAHTVPSVGVDGADKFNVQSQRQLAGS